MSQERHNYSGNSLEKTSTEIYSDLKALQDITKFDSAAYEKDLCFGIENIQTLDTSYVETENSFGQNNLDQCPLNLDLNVTKSVETNEDKFENVNLKSPSPEKNQKCPIYAEVRKDRSKNIDESKISNDLNAGGPGNGTTGKNAMDVHTLTVLWLIFSGCNVEECLLEGNEMAGVNFGAFLPTDPKVMKLLLEAGAVEQSDVEGCDYESQVILFF